MEIQLADSRSSGNRTTEVTLWGEYSPMFNLEEDCVCICIMENIYCFLMYYTLETISGVVWRHQQMDLSGKLILTDV